MLVNIADDPDLIDAIGGYNFGCYIKSKDSNKGKKVTVIAARDYKEKKFEVQF